MRIVHVIPSIAEEASGPTYSVLHLCRSMIAQGHQLTLAALDWAPLPGKPSFLKTFPLAIGPRRLGRSPSMLRWLSERCTVGDVDIIHNHGMWQMNAIYPAWAARRADVQLMYSPRGTFSKWAMGHGSFAKRLFWPLLQHPALRQATCFHATAVSEYEDIRRLGFRQPVAVIPNGIDVPPLPVRKEGAQRTLLFLGRIHVVKGLDILLPAWREVEEQFPDWQLVIAGSDDGYHGSSGYLDRIRSEVQHLALQRVTFAGRIHGKEKLQAYRDADIFVLPSYSENFAITVAEALSLGTPAIVSKGAPWSALGENGAGWWVDIGVEPLTACLRAAMAHSREDLAAMGHRGRAWVQNALSWESIGARMSETYRWLNDRSLPVPAWVRLD